MGHIDRVNNRMTHSTALFALFAALLCASSYCEVSEEVSNDIVPENSDSLIQDLDDDLVQSKENLYTRKWRVRSCRTRRKATCYPGDHLTWVKRGKKMRFYRSSFSSNKYRYTKCKCTVCKRCVKDYLKNYSWISKGNTHLRSQKFRDAFAHCRRHGMEWSRNKKYWFKC